MRKSLVSILACPDCRASVSLSDNADSDSPQIETGMLACDGCNRQFNIEQGIARMLPLELMDAQKDEMQARDDQVEMYDQNTFLNVFGQVEIPLTLSKLAPAESDFLLEAGCGTGRMTQQLASKVDAQVSVDFSFESLLVNSKKLKAAGIQNVDLIQADICNLPFKPKSFHKALSCQVLEHVPGNDARRAAVKSIASSTKLDSTVIISAYQHWSFMGAKEGRHDGGIPFFRFTETEFKKTLSSAMTVESVTGNLVYLYLAKCRTYGEWMESPLSPPGDISPTVRKKIL